MFRWKIWSYRFHILILGDVYFHLIQISCASDTLFLYLIEIWKLSSNEFLNISNSNFENNQGWKKYKIEKPER